jgi:DNA primase large subunit
MQRSTVKKRPHVSYTLEKLLKHSVLLYELPPMCDISLFEFEELALERLKVLRIFEQVSNKILKTYSDEWKAEIIAELNHAGLKSYVRLLNGNGKKEADMAARRRDYLSHFILRFCYCQSEELKR